MTTHQQVRDQERDAIADYLAAEADSWYKSYYAAKTKTAKTLAWRNYAAYSSAAAQVRENWHRQERVRFPDTPDSAQAEGM